jgi:hypothetical protein
VLGDSPIASNNLTPIFVSDTPKKVYDRDSTTTMAQSYQCNSRRQLEFSKEFLDLIDDPPYVLLFIRISLNILFISLNRLPPDRPAIPSVGVVVRKRNERQKLHGYECNCCKKVK